MHAYRSHTCADLSLENKGDTVRLSGWVHRVRDHGGVLFLDLRDHYGITQVICDPDSPAFAGMEKVRAEWCVRIDGAGRLWQKPQGERKRGTGSGRERRREQAFDDDLTHFLPC